MKKKYEFILWDIDDTLIDFKASESAALRSCFEQYGVELLDSDIRRYSEINHNYWKLLEQGKVVKSEMLVQRFTDFINILDKPNIDGSQINNSYQLALGDYVVMFDYGMELCIKLKETRKQYAVTNGTIVAQEKKLQKTGLNNIFDNVFISDKVGYQKPDLRYFEYCFQQIPDFQKEKAILIGDSLTSDMKGGNLAGIDCCWFNHRKEEAPSDLKMEYEIQSLLELNQILELN